MSGEVQNLSQQQSGEADEQSLLDEIVRKGARRMAALETEVAAYVEAHAADRDADGRALVVRGQA